MAVQTPSSERVMAKAPSRELHSASASIALNCASECLVEACLHLFFASLSKIYVLRQLLLGFMLLRIRKFHRITLLLDSGGNLYSIYSTPLMRDIILEILKGKRWV